MKFEDIFFKNFNSAIRYSVGNNASENFSIIDCSKDSDIWFHVKDYASCHVVASIPEELKLTKKDLRYIIKQGAVLCKKYSKYSNVKDLTIIYTTISNVQKTNVIGSVLTNNIKTIYI
jgi:predicted ribosome quality control (RQC) complex YloA/Tae2 family protein